MWPSTKKYAFSVYQPYESLTYTHSLDKRWAHAAVLKEVCKRLDKLLDG